METQATDRRGIGTQRLIRSFARPRLRQRASVRWLRRPTVRSPCNTDLVHGGTDFNPPAYGGNVGLGKMRLLYRLR